MARAPVDRPVVDVGGPFVRGEMAGDTLIAGVVAWLEEADMREGFIIALMLVLFGALRVVLQLVDGGAWGWEPTVGAILVAAGLLALGVELRLFRQRRTP